MNATVELPSYQSSRAASDCLEIEAHGETSARPRRPIPWLTVIVIAGLALRAYHYLSDLPVWHDEAAQIYNVLHKDYSQILEPLYYSEACPPLFLVAEKIVVQLLGDGTFALRLLPFVASCLAFVILVILARRILPPPALLWFALLLGCSDRLLNHSCETKPYAVDVLVATFVLTLGYHLRNDHRRLLAACVFLSPVMVFLSFPACFLLGGVALTLLPAVWQSRRKLSWLLYVSFCVSLGCSFLLLYFTAIQAQKNERMIACWDEKFPPWGQPWLVPVMAIVRLTEVARYAAEPVGNVFVPLAGIGALWLWRRGQQFLVGLLLFPIALNGVAWLLSNYPMEASRVVVYTAPAVLLLIAAGIPPTLSWLSRWGRLAPIALMGLLIAPVGLTALVLVKPWGRLDSRTPAAFVLERRLPNDPVVGTLWEQDYYFRRLGPYYRTLAMQPTEPPSLPSAAALNDNGSVSEESAKSLWIMSSHNPEQQAAHVSMLQPAGLWRIMERHAFRDVIVLRVERY